MGETKGFVFLTGLGSVYNESGGYGESLGPLARAAVYSG